MLRIVTEEAPELRDFPVAVKIQKWFSHRNIQEGIALQAYCGRGIYEGVKIHNEMSIECQETFSFEQEKESLKDYMRQAELSRKTTDWYGKKLNAEITGMEAVIRYNFVAHDGKTVREENASVVFDPESFTGLHQTMEKENVLPEWFAWISVENGKVMNLITSENQDSKASPAVMERAQLLYEELQKNFHNCVNQAGYQNIDGILITSAAPGYDFNHMHYYARHDKAIYDDMDNIVIILDHEHQ